MPLLSRRNVMAAGAALPAVSMLPDMVVSPVEAAAPVNGKQAPGWYRYKVGDIEITVVSDGTGKYKFADNHVINKTRADVNAARLFA